jgi:hypothetical protein
VVRWSGVNREPLLQHVLASMLDLVSILAGWAVVAMELHQPRITIVNASRDAMSNVVVEAIEQPMESKEQASENLGTIPPGVQIHSALQGTQRLDSVRVRFRTTDMESTLSCGPIEPGQRLILTNTDKGSACDFQ